MHVNFYGGKGYVGQVPAEFCFTGLRKLDFQSEQSITGRVFECAIGDLNDGFHCSMHISLSSVFNFEFQNLEIDAAEVIDFVQSIS